MRHYFLLSLITSIALFCVSCSDNDIPPPDSQITDAVQSRSLSTSPEHYYYYRGKKIPLNVTYFTPGKTYTLSVTASNQYSFDTYYFEYTHPYSNGMLNENQKEEEEQQ